MSSSTVPALKFHTRGETQVAAARLVVAALHLVAVAGLLHIGPATSGETLFGLWQLVFTATIVTCCVAAAMLTPARGLRRLRGALVPCLSLPPWDSDKSHAWFPSLGWRPNNEALRIDVEKRFAVPMVVIALMVLPLFAAEHFLQAQIANSATLDWCLSAASGLVWAAFTLEFVVRCSIAEKKIAYVKQHWLDAIVILLPLIAFLRAARLARVAKIQKTARVFRLRGVAMRLWKAVVLFDLLERLLFRNPERRLAHLQSKRRTLQDELDQLDEKIAAVENLQKSAQPRKAA